MYKAGVVGSTEFLGNGYSGLFEELANRGVAPIALKRGATLVELGRLPWASARKLLIGGFTAELKADIMAVAYEEAVHRLVLRGRENGAEDVFVLVPWIAPWFNRRAVKSAEKMRERVLGGRFDGFVSIDLHGVLTPASFTAERHFTRAGAVAVAAKIADAMRL